MAAEPALRTPAGFWKRYVAYFIDLIIASVAAAALTTPLLPWVLGEDAQRIDALVRIAMTGQPLAAGQDASPLSIGTLIVKLVVFSGLAYAIVGGAYFALCESSAWQATLGKRLIGIKVVADDGSRIGLGRAIARFFAAGLSWATLNVGHAMAAFTADRRALHDYLAGTRVENADPARTEMPAWGWAVVAANVLLVVLVIVGTVMATWYALSQASLVG